MVIFHSYVNVYQRVNHHFHGKKTRVCDEKPSLLMGKTVKLVKLNCFKGFQTRVKLPEGNPITKDKSIHVIFFIQIGGLIFEARSPPAVFAAGDNAFVEVHG